jgi:hypothetical protein
MGLLPARELQLSAKAARPWQVSASLAVEEWPWPLLKARSARFASYRARSTASSAARWLRV